jgi:hypothetical protein
MSRDLLREPPKIPSDPAVSYSASGSGRVVAPERERTPAGRRGRPIEMQPAMLLERIQKLASRRDGLFRIHRTHRDLYSRARRQFGSWAAAVQAAGLDYEIAMRRARARSIENRRKPTRSRPG